MIRYFALAAALVPGWAQEQTGNVVVSSGYNYSSGTAVVPGQVFSLFAQGINAPAAFASTLPLPTELSGVRVVVVGSVPNPNFPTVLPILSVRPTTDCVEYGPLGACAANVVVQFPLEPICLIVGGIGCIPGPAYAVDVAVEVNGIVGRSFRISPTGLPHFLNSCDSINVNPTGICHPLTTHADGSFVAGIGLDPGWSPAHLGETINIYAVGLGSTLNGKTGQAASAPDRVTYDVYLTPALVTSTSAVFGTPVKADWAGLTPGYVGLYQINLTLPSNLPFAIPAGGYAGCSNLRLFWGQLTQENVSSDVPYVDVCVASASN